VEAVFLNSFFSIFSLVVTSCARRFRESGSTSTTLGKGGILAALFFLASCKPFGYIVDDGEYLRVIYLKGQNGTCYYHGPKTVNPEWTCPVWEQQIFEMDFPKCDTAEMLIIREDTRYISFFYYDFNNCENSSPPPWPGR